MAEVAWFENALGSFVPTRAAAPPAIATDTARFHRHRTIFISDTHLGTRGCKAEALADFLAHNDCETAVPGGRHRGWLATEAPLVLDGRTEPGGGADPAQGGCRYQGDLRPRQS